MVVQKICLANLVNILISLCLGLFQFHGGTNFGNTAGRFVVTSYDYDSPIDEYGTQTKHDSS